MGCNELPARGWETRFIAFSILYRIEWVVTVPSRRTLTARELTFSILYRIEWVVTTDERTLAAGTGFFQYPVSDRMGCNL